MAAAIVICLYNQINNRGLCKRASPLRAFPLSEIVEKLRKDWISLLIYQTGLKLHPLESKELSAKDKQHLVLPKSKRIL